MSNWPADPLPKRRSILDVAPPLPDLGRRLWEAEPGPVLTYARLCTKDGAAAAELAAQSASHELHSPRRGGERPGTLPTVPVALRRVLDTAAVWATTGSRAAVLAPGLAQWMSRDRAERRTGRAPDSLALRGLRDFEPADGELFWWSCVEGVPVAELARRLARPEEYVSVEVDRVTERFRERCRVTHSLQQPDPVCRSYAGLLDAAARECAPTIPADLLQHLDGCAGCTEAFTCLSPGNPMLPVLAAEAVLPWRGSVYVSRRRQQLAEGAAAPTGRDDDTEHPSARAARAAPFGGRLRLVAAVAVAVLLPTIVVAGATSDGDAPPRAASPGPAGPVPVPTGAGGPTDGRTATVSARPTDSPSPSARSSTPGAKPGSSPGTTPGSSPGASQDEKPPADEPSADPPPPVCPARLNVSNSWPDGIQADLTLVPGRALEEGWVVSFALAEGAEAERVWHGRATTRGDRVAVTADTYNRTYAAGATVTIGLVLRGRRQGPWLSDVRVDGRPCRF
ncbi:Endoglucanase E-2 precursor [Streptomyces sp. ADI96-02]|uniref:cellulose binding domain-containing protein n=1 Tax=Streptomyces sp. ADI96-02 TaxID=1522760 RepID=UPI000F54E259|nr:cellulose binding domain-containing protein [Streptomyces sp. ADI96-02]RPK54873.1 Endoglucanase E-2 precursor [Streptomyces sp. ADI96-02]